MAPKERGLSTMASQQAGQLTSITPTPRMAVLLLHCLAEHVRGKAAGGSQEAQPEPRTARPRAVGPLDFLSRIALHLQAQQREEERKLPGDKFEYVPRSWWVSVADQQKTARLPPLGTEVLVSLSSTVGEWMAGRTDGWVDGLADR